MNIVVWKSPKALRGISLVLTLLLAVSIILLLTGALGQTAFMTVLLGFLMMFIIVVAATVYYISK